MTPNFLSLRVFLVLLWLSCHFSSLYSKEVAYQHPLANYEKLPNSNATFAENLGRIFFLQPTNNGNNNNNCATNGNCCGYRCPLATPSCGTGPTSAAQCAIFAVNGGNGPATALGTPCLVDTNCDACATNTAIRCFGMLECMATTGSDICPWI